jgi:CheY-like chemotaxis protein
MKTLLVLEDEPSVMKLLRHMLKEYHVIEATTPEEALIRFTDLNQVDLLVADLILPNMSGLQVALNLRSKRAALPVILTSGFPVSGWSARDSADLEALGGKAVAVLQKPFHKQILLNAVCELIGSAQPDKARTA